MVVEKMKLRILNAISEDLANHVDQVFDDLSSKKSEYYSLSDVIHHYLKVFDKPLSHISSTKRVMDVVETKRDISFIFYCLCCPFFYKLGVAERFSKNQTKMLMDMLNIKHRKKLSDYIISGKHYYRFYADYKEKIDFCIHKNINKE